MFHLAMSMIGSDCGKSICRERESSNGMGEEDEDCFGCS